MVVYKEDEEFFKASQIIGENIQKISQNVNTLQRMVNQSQHVHLDKIKIHEYQNTSNSLARETNNLLRKLSYIPTSGPSEKKQRKILKDRLTNDFSQILKDLQDIEEKFVRNEKYRATQPNLNNGQDMNLNIEANDRVQNAIELQIQDQVQADGRDLEQLRRRQQEMEKIESDVVQIHQIFSDLAAMVNEQGELIDNIEANVDVTVVKVEVANKELEKARSYQTSARKKMMFIVLFLIIALIIIGVVVYFTTVKK